MHFGAQIGSTCAVCPPIPSVDFQDLACRPAHPSHVQLHDRATLPSRREYRAPPSAATRKSREEIYAAHLMTGWGLTLLLASVTRMEHLRPGMYSGVKGGYDNYWKVPSYGNP